MTKEEIIHLGTLSRIKLSESEVATFSQEIDSILEYVSVVKNITSDEDVDDKKVGAVFNVLREDDVTNVPGTFTEVLLEAMPNREGQFMAVKKILQPSQ
jgi:aspartyl-tRNA(Asn)/glutamyl-tRNA(Gln) amidotransferase subunit C